MKAADEAWAELAAAAVPAVTYKGSHQGAQAAWGMVPQSGHGTGDNAGTQKGRRWPFCPCGGKEQADTEAKMAATHHTSRTEIKIQMEGIRSPLADAYTQTRAPED